MSAISRTNSSISTDSGSSTGSIKRSDSSQGSLPVIAIANKTDSFWQKHKSSIGHVLIWSAAITTGVLCGIYLGPVLALVGVTVLLGGYLFKMYPSYDPLEVYNRKLEEDMLKVAEKKEKYKQEERISFKQSSLSREGLSLLA